MLRTLSFVGASLAEGVVVGILSGHNPAAWDDASCKDDGSFAMIQCNLRVFEAAVAAAAAAGVEMLVLPEAYALSGNPTSTGFFENHAAQVGGTPCFELPAEAVAPQQKALSCMAKRNRVALAANIFSQMPDQSRRITEIVFDRDGTVVATHDKMHLAPMVETGIFKEGPFEAPTFDLLGRRWGILICYEGIYGWTLGLGDFSQHQGMVDQGATTFVWSVGGMVPPEHYSSKIAKKFNVAVVASEDDSIVSHAGAIVDSNGDGMAMTNVPLDLGSIGYSAKAVMNYATLPDTVATMV
jgi:hypothetical protein